MNGLSMWLQSLLYRKLMGKVLPVSWFAQAPPATLSPTPRGEQMQLQIVSHCWQYAHLLIYQISSLVQHPPQQAHLSYTLYYAEEDLDTARLVAFFDQQVVPGITWQWRPLPRAALFRRAIGRNQAALASEADWVWFTDCDTLFLDSCLDSLTTLLTGCTERLVFPASERITPLLEATDDILTSVREQPRLTTIDTDEFDHNDIRKAKGAFQIVHGDVCRALGYCNGIGLYQQPTDQWRKTFEDSVFRKLLRTEGKAIDIRGLHRIRHIEKGRYREDSGVNTAVSGLRKGIRRNIDVT